MFYNKKRHRSYQAVPFFIIKVEILFVQHSAFLIKYTD